MALRVVLYALMALGLAGFLGVGWVAMRSAPPPAPTEATVPAPPPPPPKVVMLVAARPLHAGALIVPDDMAAHEQETASPTMILDTPAARVALLGGMIRQNLVAGAPLFADSVLRPKDRGFLAA